MEVDKKLRAEDSQRRRLASETYNMQSQRELPKWRGFSQGPSTTLVHEDPNNAQLHVGYVFTLAPALETLQKRRTKIVVVSSPGLEDAFGEWRDTITLVPGNLPPSQMLRLLDNAGVDSHARRKDVLAQVRDVRESPLMQRQTQPASVPLIGVDAALAQQLRHKYSDGEKKRVVGLVWRTAGVRKDRARDGLLEDFAPLFLQDQFNIVSLQYGDMDTTRREVAGFHNRYRDMRLQFDDRINPMADYRAAGAQMAACDVVVGVDCSQVMQSAAHGIPTHTILKAEPPTHWGDISSGNCPYFPHTNQLYPRSDDHAWAPQVLRIREQILEQAGQVPPWSHPAAARIKPMLKGLSCVAA